MPTATNTLPPLLFITRLPRLISHLQAAAASGSNTDDDDDTPLAMLPPSASTAKCTAASIEQTPTELVRHLPQLTNPTSLGHPAALPASTSTPDSTSDELTSAAAEGHSAQVRTALRGSMQDAAADAPHPPARELRPTDAGCSSAADSRNDVTAVPPAITPVKAVQAVLISTAHPEGCVTEDCHSQSELVGSMQGLQTEQASLVQAVPSSSGRKAATGSPDLAAQQDDLLSDSESEGPLASPVNKHMSRQTTVVSEDGHKSAGTAALQGQGTPAGPLQQVQSSGEHSQGDAVPSNSNTRLDARAPVPKGGCPWPQGTDSHPDVPRQSSTADTTAPDLLSNATAAPMVTLDAGSDATPQPTSPGPKLQGPQGLQLRENPEAGVIPVVGSSASLLQAEAEAARLATLLAPPVYRPPALAHQLAEIGSRLPANNASTGSIQAPLHAQSGAATESSSPSQKAGDVPSAKVRSITCPDGAAEAGPPGMVQHPDVVEGSSTLTKLLELPGVTRQDLMKQGTSGVVPSSDLQQLVTQGNQQEAKNDGHVLEERPVTQDKQARAVSLEEEGADVVIPDR